MTRPHILFVTGKLAEPSLRRTLADLAPRAGFDFSVAVLPITVVALATTRLDRPASAPRQTPSRRSTACCCRDFAREKSRACWPRSWATCPSERGPADLRDLPEFFGSASQSREGYGTHDITILAEINHAPRLALAELLRQATQGPRRRCRRDRPGLRSRRHLEPGRRRGGDAARRRAAGVAGQLQSCTKPRQPPGPGPS